MSHVLIFQIETSDTELVTTPFCATFFYGPYHSQKTCLPMVHIIFLERIHLFVAVSGL